MLGALKRGLLRTSRRTRGELAVEVLSPEQRFQQNKLLLERELRDYASTLESHPTSLILDPANACNLKCPFCPTGGGYGNLAKGILKPDTFHRAMDHLDVDLLEEAILYNWGEPFLNRHLLEYIEFFSSRGKRTSISTNLSAADYDHEYLESVVKSGLTALTASIDGARQESYEKYRVKGNLERVLGNLKRLDECKRALGAENPAVVFRMLLNKYNQDEVEEARELARACGATFELNNHFWCPDEAKAEWQADSLKDEAGDGPLTEVYAPKSDGVINTFCRELWDTVIVDANGDVFPCCLIYRREHSIGNLAEQELDDIRNHERMVYLRRYAVDDELAPPSFENQCESCPTRYCIVS